MPTDREVRDSARVLAASLGRVNPDELDEVGRPMWKHWEQTAADMLMAAAMFANPELAGAQPPRPDVGVASFKRVKRNSRRSPTRRPVAETLSRRLEISAPFNRPV